MIQPLKKLRHVISNVPNLRPVLVVDFAIVPYLTKDVEFSIIQKRGVLLKKNVAILKNCLTFLTSLANTSGPM